MTFRHPGYGPDHPISWRVPVPGYHDSHPKEVAKKNAGGKKVEAPGGGKQSEHCFIAINVAGGNKQKGANKPADGQENQEAAAEKSDAGNNAEGKKGKKNK
ncbi:hypothetical protein IWQ61_007275 [Dispira simplex]|nr:hypothetical protein IWQ61_007275 [Dispira simplex]